MHVVTSDFRTLSHRASSDHVYGIGGAFLATFSLGFTEGCLQIQRRPIPLRFALWYAAANVLPSVVWRSIPVHHVAAAAGIPVSSLVNEIALASSRSVSVGHQLVLCQSIRALRLAAGSYGLAWGLWHYWHEHATNKIREDTIFSTFREKVVRVASVDSPLSRVSKQNHGNHIFTMAAKHRDAAVDWETFGLFVRNAELNKRVKVVEFELSAMDNGLSDAEVVKDMVSKVKGEEICSVAVLPGGGPVVPLSVVESFDVCFNPLSAVLKFIASICNERKVFHIILVSSRMEKFPFSTSQVAIGLLHRHGITTSQWTLEDIKDDESFICEEVASQSAKHVFYFSSSSKNGHLMAQKMQELGHLGPKNEYFIVEEHFNDEIALSHHVQAKSDLIELSADDRHQVEATYFSLADVTDQTLQGIRNLIRQGKKADAIQTAVYQTFGPQRVVTPLRLDQFSNLHIL
ncbi:hypothetical protein CCR75_007918 [Bremia lactucae]|uniref:Uncharacterized protein n=1 Tax=Bremia lactucae TaxID=4779 RepID=A0A976FQU5_BRELC|nr:hypothetical protein CCR75_007918 [Bremia lactucae]